jgi:hypothetical protein
MSDVFVALLSSVLGVAGGYFFGIARSRHERRDNAIADITRQLSSFTAP